MDNMSSIVYPNYTYTWPVVSHAKCPNCGYCSCCGKSDVQGKLTKEETHREVEQFGSSSGS